MEEGRVKRIEEEKGKGIEQEIDGKKRRIGKRRGGRWEGRGEDEKSRKERRTEKYSMRYYNIIYV